MDSNIILVIGMGVLLLVILVYVVVNESKKKAAADSTTMTAQQYIDEQNAKGQSDADLLGIDPEELRRIVNEEYDQECMLAPPCPGTTVMGENGCCELTEKQISEFRKGMMITEGIVREIMISYIFSKTVSTLYKAAKRTGQIARGTKVSAATTRQAVRTVSKGAASAATKTSMRAAIKMGGRRVLSKAITLVGGPVGAAVFILEMTSLALDLIDPFGYEKYQPNVVSKNIRNTIDVETRKGMLESEPELRTDYPLTFPLLLAFPDLEEEFTQEYMGKFLPDALKLFKDDDLVDAFVYMLTGEVTQDSTKTSEEISKMIEDNFTLITSVKRTERDNFIYDFFKDKGKESKIEKVPFMSTYRRFGVTLSQEGANDYNASHRDEHIKFGGFGRGGDCAKNHDEDQPDIGDGIVGGSTPDEGEAENVNIGPCNDDPACKWDTNAEVCITNEEELTPDDYTPFVAMYTDTYRVLDTSNPGNVGEPNVIERRLPQKCVLAMPYAGVIEHCWNVADGHTGVEMNTETGLCNYNQEFCSQFVLNYNAEQNDCELREGQGIAETIFGKTVTRQAINFGNRVGDFFKSF
jgi:hypothetical protein